MELFTMNFDWNCQYNFRCQFSPNWPIDLLQYQWNISTGYFFFFLCTQVKSKIYIKGKESERAKILLKKNDKFETITSYLILSFIKP